MGKKKYYAVKAGRETGLFCSWEEVEPLVKGYPKAVYKGFGRKEDALKFLGSEAPDTGELSETTERLEAASGSEREKAAGQKKVATEYRLTEPPKLTAEQQAALDIMRSGANIFLSGEAGTGKSFVIERFISEQRRNNKRVIICAPTGVAALNIGGATMHRTFKIPRRPLSFKDCCKRDKVLILSKADIIIIDEISMCRFDVFEYAMRRVFEQADRAVQIILVGDFCQLPPVVTNEDKKIFDKIWDGYGQGFAFLAPSWKLLNLKNVVLHEIIRQSEPEFIENLNKARLGDASCVDWLNSNHNGRSLNAVNVVPTKREALSKNLAELSKIQNPQVDYKAEVEGDILPKDYPTEEILNLKVGARVMCLVNNISDNPEIINGSFGTIIRFTEDSSVVVKFDDCQDEIEIAKYTWNNIRYELNKKGEIEEKVTGKFSQLPLRLAYAITIHKSQGQTFQAVNITPWAFTPGQLYVALSRARSIGRLHLNSRINPQFLIAEEDVVRFYNNDYRPAQPKEYVQEEEPDETKKKIRMKSTTVKIPENFTKEQKAEIKKMVQQYVADTLAKAGIQDMKETDKD